MNNNNKNTKYTKNKKNTKHNMICKKRIGDLLLLSLEHDIYDIETQSNEKDENNENNENTVKREYLATIPCYKHDIMESMYILYGRAFLHGNYTIENKNKIFIITNLFTNVIFRGNNYASQLLCRAIYESRRNKCKYIKLTDCTDLFQHSKNIYIKHGFTYDEWGSPEMTLKL